MLLLEKIVQQEKSRIENMILLYTEELSSLPRGSLVRKNINGKEYFYIQYRNGKKCVSKYVGNSENKLSDLKGMLERRRQIELLLKKLKKEHSLALKYMEVSQ